MMNSSCVAGCLDAQVPVRLNFRSLYKWPDSDAEFVRVLSMDRGASCPNKITKVTTIHESYACRQKFLRSYTFSKKETFPQKTKNGLKKAKAVLIKMKKNFAFKRILSLLGNLEPKFFKVSCAVLAALFTCLLACTTSVDVKDQQLLK
ncbi:hypothetical protein SUGI_0434490 [Cryptomeria japonica]|uniref:uncharacterized protein LOC131061806 n=1 Tax=Cryptomeria japonica TaxID=3369 RepID=UPI002408E540|nr:uncharacterized protein LOC131061806 [Cryptomeria japonica]GLJ23022.1 hypothetical protein SUGI_0434490 [Cryptomeria japonica]